MDPLAGSSKTENTSQGNCKKKCKLYHEGSANVTFTNIDSLPDEMLIFIFDHLDVLDKFRVQKVCSRWRNLARDEVLWRHVNMPDISPSFFVGLLTSLPSCVYQLRIQLNYTCIPLSLTELMVKLQNQCPQLNTVFLEDINFKKYKDCVKEQLIKRKPMYEKLSVYGLLTKSAKKILECEFGKKEDTDFMHVVLSELKILSLRHVSTLHTFSHITAFTLPNLVVLDLSESQSLGQAILNSDLFCTLVNLEELYLVAWHNLDISMLSFLKHMKKLKVLDLGYWQCNDETFSFLKENCVALEELYLCNTNIKNIYRSGKDKDFFSKLQTLCLITSNFLAEGIDNLLSECPSLKHIDVTGIRVPECWYNSLSKDIKEVLCLSCKKGGFCCEHFLTKYCYF